MKIPASYNIKGGDRYDMTLLDCPPGMTLLSESVFDDADALLIPTTLSLRTLKQLHRLIVDTPPLGLAPFLLDADLTDPVPLTAAVQRQQVAAGAHAKGLHGLQHRLRRQAGVGGVRPAHFSLPGASGREYGVIDCV